MYRNREDAGHQLAEALKKYAERDDVVVVALPRGGVVLGRIIADALQAPLDVVVPRKIGAPGQTEYAIGAVTESGHVIWNEEEKKNVSQEFIKEAVDAQTTEAKRRLARFRKDLPLRNLKGKTVIVIDDGIATGLTMRAALKTVRTEGARFVVVAVPVAPSAIDTFAGEADEWIVLRKPLLFMSVGGFYDDFPQVEDEEVEQLMIR